MTKAELIDRIARSRDLPPDISKKLIGQVLGLAFDELANYFARARVTRSSSPRFTFPHFGTFTKKRRSARRGVNPRTLEPIQIEACDTVDFKASRELRDAMNPDRAEADSSTSKAKAKKRVAASKTKTKKKAKAKARSRTTKTTKKRASRKTTTAAKATRRRLTPREELELPPLLDEPAQRSTASESDVDSALPASPMQRVKGRRRSRSRDAG